MLCHLLLDVRGDLRVLQLLSLRRLNIFDGVVCPDGAVAVLPDEPLIEEVL